MITIKSVMHPDRPQVIGGTVIYVINLERGIEKCTAKEYSSYGGNLVGLNEKIGGFLLGVRCHPDPHRAIAIANILRARTVAKMETELAALKAVEFTIPEQFAEKARIPGLDPPEDWTPPFEDDRL
jgi:hypothetical protein